MDALNTCRDDKFKFYHIDFSWRLLLYTSHMVLGANARSFRSELSAILQRSSLNCLLHLEWFSRSVLPWIFLLTWRHNLLDPQNRRQARLFFQRKCASGVTEPAHGVLAYPRDIRGSSDRLPVLLRYPRPITKYDVQSRVFTIRDTIANGHYGLLSDLLVD
jgi:hypothetical protein